MRLLQVDALVVRHREQDKVEAYSRRIAAWWPMCGEQTLRVGRRLLARHSRRPQSCCCKATCTGVKRRMKVARLTFLARNAYDTPLASFDQHARAREAACAR